MCVRVPQNSFLRRRGQIDHIFIYVFLIFVLCCHFFSFWAPAKVISIGYSIVLSFGCFFFQLGARKMSFQLVPFCLQDPGWSPLQDIGLGWQTWTFESVLEDFVFFFFTTSVHPSCLSSGSGVDAPFHFLIGSIGGSSTFLKDSLWLCIPIVYKASGDVTGPHRRPSSAEFRELWCLGFPGTPSSSSQRERCILLFLFQRCLWWGWSLQTSRIRWGTKRVYIPEARWEYCTQLPWLSSCLYVRTATGRI